MKIFNLALIFALLLSFVVLAEEKSQAVWIDVRSWVEYQVDHIEGDERVSHDDIVQYVRQSYPDKTTLINLYCARGGRAGKAAERLKAAGYTNVENVGGIAQAREKRGLESE